MVGPRQRSVPSRRAALFSVWTREAESCCGAGPVVDPKRTPAHRAAPEGVAKPRIALEQLMGALS
jgi:hypothetical protein